jgi:hypothetical protein
MCAGGGLRSLKRAFERRRAYAITRRVGARPVIAALVPLAKLGKLSESPEVCRTQPFPPRGVMPRWGVTVPFGTGHAG